MYTAENKYQNHSTFYREKHHKQTCRKKTQKIKLYCIAFAEIAEISQMIIIVNYFQHQSKYIKQLNRITAEKSKGISEYNVHVSASLYYIVQVRSRMMILIACATE
jgi:superoxide dismutase